MPHYADGSEAKVGDQVTGKLYNSGPNSKAGVIISITPGAESCNAMVQFTEAIEGALGESMPRMAVYDVAEDGGRAVRSRVVRGLQHGTEGPTVVLYECADYCATNELTKVG